MLLIDMRFLQNNVIENIYNYSVWKMDDDTCEIKKIESFRLVMSWSEDMKSMVVFKTNEDLQQIFVNRFHVHDEDDPVEVLNKIKNMFISYYHGVEYEVVPLWLNISNNILDKKENINAIH